MPEEAAEAITRSANPKHEQWPGLAMLKEEMQSIW